jgi:hypothetical protein
MLKDLDCADAPAEIVRASRAAKIYADFLIFKLVLPAAVILKQHAVSQR